jgi:hypothetical protein
MSWRESSMFISLLQGALAHPLPTRRLRTFLSNVLTLPAGTSSPNVFMSPRIWFESSVVILTSLVRAATSVRVSMLSKPFTRTSRKNPTSARCAKPSASFASVLFAAMSSAALA